MISREKLLSFGFAAIVAFIVTFSMKMMFLNDYNKEVNDTNYKKEILDVPKTEAVVKVIKDPTVKVLVAKVPIKKGTTVDVSMLEWKDWPKSLLSETYIATEDGKELNKNLKVDSIVGLRAAHDVDAGIPATESMVFKKNEVSESDKDIKVRDGMRAFTLPVNQTSVANQMFLPGDVVDIYISTLKTFYRNVKILALDDKGSIAEIELAMQEAESGKNGDKESGAAKKRYLPKTVTLELTPNQIGQIVPNLPPAGITLILISDRERNAYMQKFYDDYIAQKAAEENYEVPLGVQTYSAQGTNEHMELVGPLMASPDDPDEEKENPAVTDPVTGDVIDQDKYTISVVKRDKATVIEIPGRGKSVSKEQAEKEAAKEKEKEK